MLKEALGYSTSKAFTIKNGPPHGSVLVILICNLYIGDIQIGYPKSSTSTTSL